MKVVNLRVNHQETPVVDVFPEFSWMLESEQRDVVQESYRITVSDGYEIVWDSGIVYSQKQSFIPYQGKPLKSRTQYLWTVQVEDNYKNTAKAQGMFETALLSESEWRAKWIESVLERKESLRYEYGTQPPPVIFKRDFILSKKIKRARLYCTAYGIYRVYINELRPDDREFAPEHTVYRSILYYQTYDVGALLKSGENTLSFYVGDGWYFCPQTKPIAEKYCKKPAILYQLEVEYIDGEWQTIDSDGSELSGTGFVIFSDIFRGEKQDNNLPFNPVHPVNVADYGYSNLKAQSMPPVRPVKLLPAVKVYISPKGERIVDFGQVICGRARVKLDIPKGKEVIFEYFETPDKDGNYLNTMYADQKDIFVSNGTPCEYEALFTFHGFRYIRVTGLDEIEPQDFIAVVLSTEKENVGFFECSDERLNRLYKNIRWSQMGNMMSIPTDCPTREKAGFTGDIQIYAKTAMLNENMTPFLTSWLVNLCAEQFNDGAVPMTVPFTRLYEALTKRVCTEFGDERLTGIAGWSDAAVFVPYSMYMVTGNDLILKACYDASKKWCDYVIKTAEEKRGNNNLPYEIDRYLFNTGFHFGEWLIPSQKTTGGNFEICKQSSVYTAPLFGYKSVKLMGEIAKVLDKEEDALYYSDIAEKMKEAIQKGLIRDGKMAVGNMGAYVLAIAFDVVPPEHEKAFAEKLVEMIEKNDYCLDTGFLATPYLLHALDKIGRRDISLKLLWQEKAPSWLYQVKKGATTIWEDWNAIAEDGTPKITSYNHYAFGCVDEWIFKAICGIEQKLPGFKHILINPCTNAGLDWCKRSFISEYGEIYVHYKNDFLEVAIPCNTTATVIWKGREHDIGSGRYKFN